MCLAANTIRDDKFPLDVFPLAPKIDKDLIDDGRSTIDLMRLTSKQDRLMVSKETSRYVSWC